MNGSLPSRMFRCALSCLVVAMYLSPAACSQVRESTGDETEPSGVDPFSSEPLAVPQIFPADNPWNTDISQSPVHANSASYITSIGLTKGLHPDFGTVYDGAPNGIPYVLVRGNQPPVPITFMYDDESDPGSYPIPSYAPIEGGASSDGDRHVLVIDVDNLKLYEVYRAFPINGGTSWQGDSGAVFDLTSNALRPTCWTSADAAGLPIFAGLVRYDEAVVQGEIRHALRFTTRRTQRAFIPPATHYASSLTDANLPPMGLRVRLRSDYDISGFSATNRAILTAMKTYGMFVADNGGDWFISGAPDMRWDDDDLHELSQVTGADFEAVFTGEAITQCD